ncbi:MAG: PaaI family thioesterase [Candidatus Heimdallarchaeota archaeon]
MQFEPKDPDYQSKVRDSFSRQTFMEYIGGKLTKLEPGRCELQLPFDENLTQQHHYFHAGVIGALADTAGGYAAFSLMPADASVLTVEYKINLMAPGDGDRLIARATVLKPGRTLTVCKVEVYAAKDNTESLVASVQMTVMTMRGKPDY